MAVPKVDGQFIAEAINILMRMEFLGIIRVPSMSLYGKTVIPIHQSMS